MSLWVDDYGLGNCYNGEPSINLSMMKSHCLDNYTFVHTIVVRELLTKAGTVITRVGIWNLVARRNFLENNPIPGIV